MITLHSSAEAFFNEKEVIMLWRRLGFLAATPYLLPGSSKETMLPLMMWTCLIEINEQPGFKYVKKINRRMSSLAWFFTLRHWVFS